MIAIKYLKLVNMVVVVVVLKKAYYVPNMQHGHGDGQEDGITDCTHYFPCDRF